MDNDLKFKINEFLKEHNRFEYQRDNFDVFLKKVKFSFNIPSIHICGTNGKGSTAYFLSSIYKENNYKVGLFTSPYFYYPNESIKINGCHISDEVFYSYLIKWDKLFKKYELSNFEIEVFIALSYFVDQNVDIAIIECGMGGEEDATNIFVPILSIITSISLEHTEFLGKSIAEIAYSKAGIIKYEVPVLISNKLDEEALNVIKEVSKENKSKIFQIHDPAFCELKDGGYIFSYLPFSNCHINFLSYYSIIDASLALEAVNILKDKFPVQDNLVLLGLEKMKLSGRMEVLSKNPLIIVDGAHNPEAMISLRESIEKIQNDKKVHVVFACFKDKNIMNMLNELSLISSDITLTTFPHYRARKKEDYFLYLEEYPFDEDYKKVIDEKINEYKDDIILITGSLAFSALIIKYLKEQKI